MSAHDDDDAPPDDVSDLLRAERARPGLADARGDAMLERLLGAIEIDPGDGSPPNPEAPPQPAAPPAAPPSTPPSAARPWPSWATFVVGSAVGGFAGAALHARLAPPPPPRVERVVERVIERVIERVEVPVATPPPLDAAAPDAAGVAARSPVVLQDRERESALLARARAAMLRGRPADALDALGEHQRTFPVGRLSEEREALAVQALAASGDRAAARARAEAFQRRYPNSPLGEVVSAVTQAL